MCETLAASRPGEALPFCDASISQGLRLFESTGHKDSRDFAALPELGKADAEMHLKRWAAAVRTAEIGLPRFEEAGRNMKMNYDINCVRAGLLLPDAWTALGEPRRAYDALRKAQELTKYVDRSDSSKFLLAKLSELDRRSEAAQEYTQKK